MSYPAELVIPITTRLATGGLRAANFGSAMLFATADETTAFPVGTYRTYFTIDAVAEDFGTQSETYRAAAAWLGGIPRLYQINIYNPDPSIADATAMLAEARNKTWWYWTLLTESYFERDDADIVAIAQWCEQNESYFMNNVTNENVLDSQVENDIVSTIDALGIRHCTSAFHTKDSRDLFDSNAESGIFLAKHFAAVNYNGVRTTITGEFKKSPGLPAMSLLQTDYATLNRKNAAYYTQVELQGSVDNGRWMNTRSHSSYGEFMDDVVNLDAFVNFLTVALYNVIANAPTKVLQTPDGQGLLHSRARQLCMQFVANGYLGPRNYTDPDTGEEGLYTPGFEILSKDTDILDITPEERADRYAAPIRIRLFRAGAIHKAPVDLTVY